ncbi:MAG: hypothetical protein GY906_22410 [bacterium]|nr:hypothetical protein [bacterium]
MDPTQAMDPITQVVTYLLPGVPVGVLLALTWLVTYVFSNFTQSLVSPVEGGSRAYLFFFRLCHRFAGNNGLVRKPPKPYPEVRRLGAEGVMAHLMAANEELRLKMAGMEEHLAALNAADKPADTQPVGTADR